MLNQIVIASSNKGKLKEFSQLFSQTDIDILPQSEFSVPDADETGLSFIENAIIKARNACLYTKLPAIADDSGLEVDALGGKPGIYSARYSRDVYGENANDQTNNQKLLEALTSIVKEKRTARFVCALAFMRHATDPNPVVCSASWEGEILEAPDGENGFGYDPLFYVPEYYCTAASLTPEVKNAISHRGKALKKLKLALIELGILV